MECAGRHGPRAEGNLGQKDIAWLDERREVVGVAAVARVDQAPFTGRWATRNA